MSFLGKLNPYAWLLDVVVIGGVVVGGGYGFHLFCEHEREIGRQEVRAEDARLAQVEEEANRKIESFQTNNVVKAQNDATKRDEVLNSVLTASGKSSDRLRNALQAIGSGVPSADTEALRSQVTALTAVLNKCQSEYRAMGANADAHASDVQTLSDAWPSAPPADVKR